MDGFTIDTLGAAIGAAGALGTACFGIVEGLKWTPLGEAGFGQIQKFLGASLEGALKIAYGENFAELLRAQYRQDWAHSVLPKTLRQGVRVGLSEGNAEAIAEFLGNLDPAALRTAATHVKQGALTDGDRGVIGRFELAVDARIDSALSRAQDVYLGTVRVAASAIGIALAELAAILGGGGLTPWLYQNGWLKGALVGTLAVPLAPIANDVVGALQAATKALRG